MRYYKVTTLRGHMGYGNSVPITFYIQAANALDASAKAQRMAGVKHTKPIMSCIPITLSEYVEGRKVSAYYAHERRIFND